LDFLGSLFFIGIGCGFVTEFWFKTEHFLDELFGKPAVVVAVVACNFRSLFRQLGFSLLLHELVLLIGLILLELEQLSDQSDRVVRVFFTICIGKIVS
jgi:hypothetical protein